MSRERSCSGTSGKSDTKITLCDKIHKNMTTQGTEKKGRKRDINSFEKAHRGFHRKNKNRSLFWEDTVWNEEDFKQSWFNGSFVLWIGIRYSEVQLKTLSWAFIQKANIENNTRNKFQLFSLYGLQNVLDFLLSITRKVAIICHWLWRSRKLLSSARHQIMGCLESTRSQHEVSYRALSTLTPVSGNTGVAFSGSTAPLTLRVSHSNILAE